MPITKETLTRRPHTYVCVLIYIYASSCKQQHCTSQGAHEWDAHGVAAIRAVVHAHCIAAIPELIETGSRWFYWHCV